MYVGVCWCEKILMLLIIMILYLLYCFVVPRWICLWFILVYICLHFSGNRPSGIFAFNMNSHFVGKQARKPVTVTTAVKINQDNDFLPHLILKITFTCCTFEKEITCHAIWGCRHVSRIIVLLISPAYVWNMVHNSDVLTCSNQYLTRMSVGLGIVYHFRFRYIYIYIYIYLAHKIDDRKGNSHSPFS